MYPANPGSPALADTAGWVVQKCDQVLSWYQRFMRLLESLERMQTVATAVAAVSFTSSMVSFGAGLMTIISGSRANQSPAPSHAPLTIAPSIQVNASTAQARSVAFSGLPHDLIPDADINYPKPDWLDTARINLAVVGATTIGKSSFVNLLRDVSPGDPVAAPIGCVECTEIPQEYAWTLADGEAELSLWDCPGTETMYWSVNYLQKVGLRYFDAVLLIMESPDFTNNEAALVHECIKYGIPIHLICNKVDIHLDTGIPDAHVQILHKFRRRCPSKFPTLCTERFYLFTSFRSQFDKYQHVFRPELERFARKLTEDIGQARLGAECETA